jgi:two-component system sensor histidine kinase QseC
MNSFRRQLTRELVLVLALLLGVCLVAIYAAIWQVLVHSFDATLQTQALAVSALTEVESGQVQFDFSSDFLHGIGVQHPRIYFELRDGVGIVLAGSSSLRGGHLPPCAGGTPERPKFWNLTLPNGRLARAVSFDFTPKPVDNKSAAPGAPSVGLVVAVDRHELNEILAGLFAAVAGGGGLLLVAVVVAVPHLLRRGLVPLQQLGEQVARIDATSLAGRFPSAKLPAELQPIADRLNDLLARLEASFERERRFSADLAHELRTPIAELRSLAECALKWPESRDAITDSEVLAIAGHMESLTASMLALVRGQSGQLAGQREPVALAAFMEEVWRPFAPRAAARGLQVGFALAPVSGMANPALLRSILSNLFDNAVDHSPEGSAVEIDLEPCDAGLRLRVANRADNLDAADVAKLFDPFWRKEAARSGGRHVGLGLSLARTFATAMDWSLTAELDERHRLVLCLSGKREG